MEELEKEFMEFFSRLFKYYGFNDLSAKVVGILYLEPKEVAMEDIAKKTGYSLASISNTMKILENIGLVQRIKKPGTKKVFFYMEKDLVKLNIQKINMAYEHLTKPMKKDLPQIINKYKHRVKDEKSRQKLQIIENYYTQVLQFERILQHWMEELEELSNSRLSIE